MSVKITQITSHNAKNKTNYGKNEKHSKNKNNFKKELEILIRLFYYNKFLKEKDNLEFKNIKQENYLSVYLINNDWLEDYKSFYDYKELEYYLLKSKNDSYIIGMDYISDESIEKIVANLPQSYIKKEEEKKFEKKITRYGTDKIKDKKAGIKREFSYLINNQIINQKIKDALTNVGSENIEISLKNCRLYFIGNKRILLLFNSELVNDNNEIGTINDNNTFIPEFILFNEDNNLPFPYLNIFFQKSFPSFISNQENQKCFIFGKNILF